MTDESAVAGPPNPKKRELARNITQLLTILEKSDCDEFDDVESVVSMGWDSSDDGEVSADNIQQNTDDADQQPNIATSKNDTKGTNVDWETNPQNMQNVPFLKKDSLLVSPIGNTPINYFRHIISSDQYLQEVVEQTNQNAINDFYPSPLKNSLVYAFGRTLQ
ncbi:hypothetical protein JTB14_029417 [Gonioctena quinquepunctata]|nr:hypothetical protein JTB14_029417 [Gonioctena quinquepunctata]